MEEENKQQAPIETPEAEAAEESTEKKPPVDEPYQVFQYQEPESYEYTGTYFVYGMAIGLMVGIVLFFLFGQNKILLSIATIGGAIIGAFMKKKAGPKNK